MFTVTTHTPAGKTRQATVTKIKEAGQIVAWTLADNLIVDRKEATKLAMQAEKERTLQHAGYTFTIEREGMIHARPDPPHPLQLTPHQETHRHATN